MSDKKRSMLVVEDEAPVRRMVVRAFADDYEIHEAGDGVEGLETARRVRPDVVITDNRMPKMSGVEMLAKIREELPGTVRVLITGYTDYGSLVDAVNEARVHHYLEKPFHTVDVRTVVETLHHAYELSQQRDKLLLQLEESVRLLEKSNALLREKEKSLSRAVDDRTDELQRANEELKITNQRLRDLAVRDGLTGLFNHRYLMEHLEIELARSNRYERQFSLLFIDIDNFKQVNDLFGHAVGDSVLITVADALRAVPEGLRRSDFSARYGGEEFCVLLPETPLEGGRLKADRLRKRISTIDWRRAARDLTITVSIGVAAFPDHGSTSQELLRAADAALYEAKRAGKDRVAVAAKPAA